MFLLGGGGSSSHLPTPTSVPNHHPTNQHPTRPPPCGHVRLAHPRRPSAVSRPVHTAGLGPTRLSLPPPSHVDPPSPSSSRAPFLSGARHPTIHASNPQPIPAASRACSHCWFRGLRPPLAQQRLHCGNQFEASGPIKYQHQVVCTTNQWFGCILWQKY